MIDGVLSEENSEDVLEMEQNNKESDENTDGNDMD